MSLDEFREDLKQLLRQHPGLDAEDLRDVSDRLNKLADRWDDEEEVL